MYCVYRKTLKTYFVRDFESFSTVENELLVVVFQETGVDTPFKEVENKPERTLRKAGSRDSMI